MRKTVGLRSPAADSSESLAQSSLDINRMHRAASAGDVVTVQSLLLLGKSNLNDRDKLDRTALHLACANGHRDVVTLLVERKCQLDLQDSENKTALVKAVQGQREECAAILLAHGADPNVADFCGNTALHYAAQCGNTLLAQTLLSHKADIEAKNKDSLTPLLLAVNENEQQMAEFLIKKKADMHTVDKMQRLPHKPVLEDSWSVSHDDFNTQTKERPTKSVTGEEGNGVDVGESDPKEQETHDSSAYDDGVHRVSTDDFSVWNSTGLTLSEEASQTLQNLKIDDKYLLTSQPVTKCQSASTESGQRILKDNIGIVFLYGNETPHELHEPQLSESKVGKKEMTSENDQEGIDGGAKNYPQVEAGKKYKNREVEISRNMNDGLDKLIQKRQTEPTGNQLLSITRNEDFNSSDPSLYIKEGKEKERKRHPAKDPLITSVTEEFNLLACSQLQVNEDNSFREIAKNDGRIAKETPNEKNKVENNIKSASLLDDQTQSSEVLSEDCVLPYSNYENFMLLIEQLGKDYKDSVTLMKIRDAVLSYERLIELKGNHCELLAGKIEEMKHKVSGLQKELSEAKEMKSQLELQKVEWDRELCGVRFSLKQEEENRRNAVFLYEKMKEQLRKTEEQYSKEVEARQQLEFSLRTLDVDLKSARSNFFQVSEELNDVQRQLSEQKNARALQEGVLSNRLCQLKELERTNEKVNSEFQETLNILQEENEKRHLKLEEKIKELINECNSLREALHQSENEKEEREATVRQLQEELAYTLEKKTMLESSLASHIKSGDKEDLKKQVDDLTAKLKSSTSECLRLDEQKQVLQQELLAMKKMLKRYQKLERNKQKLEEQVTDLKSYIENRMVDFCEVEQYKIEIEERARQEIAEKLKEVNIFLQEQAASQEYLAQLREDNDALTRNQIELRIKDLESEVSTMKNSRADSYKRKVEVYTQQIANLESELSDVKSQGRFYIEELEKYKQLYLEQCKEKKSVEDKLKETNEGLREIINTRLVEIKQEKRLFSTLPTRLQSPLMAKPKSNVMSQRNLSAKENLAIPTSSPQHSNNNMEAYIIKMQKQLELNITRELEEAAAELEPEASGSFLVSVTNTLNGTQDLLLKTSQEYADVLKKNHMI